MMTAHVKRTYQIVKQLYLTVAVVAFVALDMLSAEPGASLLASGHWVKIRVNESGMHQISDDELRAMGFVNPEQVSVFGFPAAAMADYRLYDGIPSDLPPVTSMRRNGKLLFYAEGPVMLDVFSGKLPTGPNSGLYTRQRRNFYADYSTYFLSDSQPITVSEPVALPSDTQNPVMTSWGMEMFEEEVVNVGEMGARYLGTPFSRQNHQEFRLSMPGYDPDGGVVKFLLLVGHRLNKSRSQQVTLPSGKPVTSLYMSQHSASDYDWYGQALLMNDNNTAAYPLGRTEDDIYTVTIENNDAEFLAVDYLTALYPRHNDLRGLQQSVFAFNNVSAGGCFGLTTDTDARIEIWQIVSPYDIRPAVTAPIPDGDGVIFGLNGEYGASDYTYAVAFNPDSEYPGVECLGDVPSQNLHSMQVPHMLVVTAPRFLSHAERLADIHRRLSGIDVAVVTPEEVYNEFSSGTPSLMAVRSMARMLHDRDPQKFRSILFIGPANWDNRYLTEADPEACRRKYVPMFMCEDHERAGLKTQSYQTDAFVGMLADDGDAFNIFDTDMTIGVGRIPVETELHLDSYIHKVEKYLSELPSAEIKNTALLTSDYGDQSGHMVDADNMADIIRSVSPATTVVKCHLSVYPIYNGIAEMIRSKEIDVLKQGTAMMLFTGHSITGVVMSLPHVWDMELFEQNSCDFPPLAVLLTCSAADPGHRRTTMADQLLTVGNGGAMGVVASCRTVYKEENIHLGKELVRNTYINKPGNTYGTVMRDSHNGMIAALPGASQRRRAMANRLAFNLYGDPEIPLPYIPRSVVLKKAGEADVPASGETSVMVEGGTRLALEGEVNDASGVLDAGFNGTVKVNIYEAPRIMQAVNKVASGDEPAYTSLDNTVVASKCLDVTEGRFTGEIYVPRPLVEGDCNRVQFYAESADGLTAAGCCGTIRIIAGEHSGDIPDVRPPVISEIYLDSPAFADGDVVGASPRLYVRLDADEYGILPSYPVVGKDMTVTIDGGSPLPHVAGCLSGAADGTYAVECPLGVLPDGRHTLEFRISNTAGQTTHASLNFVVVSTLAGTSLDVNAEPCSGMATVSLYVPENITADEVRLVIRDSAGNAVLDRSDSSFPFDWDLSATDGLKVPRGVYSAQAWLRAGRQYGATPPVEFVIHY